MAITTVHNELIAVNAISGTAIADNAVTSIHIAKNNIGTVQIAQNSVTSVSIALNQVTGTQIANNAITSTQLADNAVTATKIPDGTQLALGATNFSGEIHVGGTSVAAGTATLMSDGHIKGVLSSGGSGDTLIGAISGVSNGHQIIVDSSNNQTYKWFNGSTNSMIIDSSGKVGIGDSSPFTKLHVEDTSWSSGAPYGAVAYIQGGAVNDLNWGHLLITQSGTTTDTGGRLSFGANGENPIAGIRTKYKGATYGDLAFLTRPSGGTNTERMVIDSSGKVGIGETSPAATLHVEHSSSTAYNGAAEITESLIVSNKNGTDDSGVNNVASIGLHVADGATSQGFINYVRTGNNTGNFTFTQRTAASTYAEAMRIDSNGKVGIGTTSPAELLQIGAGASSVHGTLLISADNGLHNYIRFTNGGGSEAHYPSGIWYSPSGRMELRAASSSSASNAAQLVLKEDGNVGIGDSTPSYKLDVQATGAAVAAFRGESGPYGMIIGGNDAGWGYIGSIGHANYDLTFNNDGYAHFGHGENTSFIYLGSQGGAYGGNSSHNLRASGGTFMYNSGSSNHVWEIGGVQRGYLNSAGWQNGSDVSLKENIQDITYGLDTVKLLKPRKFDWKDSPADDKAEIGFIAQEVESIIPEIVSNSRPDGEGTSIKGMSYANLTAVLVKAIQELEARVKELEG